MSRFIHKCIIAAGLLCMATASRAELLSEQWWQWALSVPGAINPILDETGSRAGINNDGSVFFLAGNNWAGTSARTVSVPEGRPVFFPVMNNVYVFTPPNPIDNPDDCINISIKQNIDWATCGLNKIDMSRASELKATLDGNPLSIYRETSTALFDVTLPVGNIFEYLGDPNAPAGSHAAVSDGYWVALAPLARGQHVLEFGGKKVNQDGSDSTLTIIDVLNVPEPPTLMIALSALAALALVRRRRAQV